MQFFLGVIKSKPVPQFDTKSNEKFWIPRSEFLNCFLGDITKSKKIKILYSSSCSNIDIDDDGKVCVTIESENDRSEVKKIRPDFILGCDGANSVVRNWLSTKEKKGENKFSTVTIPSDAAGLRYKMLTLKNRYAKIFL